MDTTSTSDFWEKLLLLVIDKVLLAAAGAAIAYIAAKALERYRRQQSVTLELGRLRAQAYARALALLTEYQLRLDHLGMLDGEGEVEAEHIADFEQQFESLKKDVVGNLYKEVSLLDREVSLLLLEYVDVIAQRDKMRINGRRLTQEDVEAHRAKVRAIRERLLTYLPALPRPD